MPPSHGLGPAPTRPTLPPSHNDTKHTLGRLKSRHLFWSMLWPSMEEVGWTLEPGKRGRENDYYFISPNLDRATARYRVDYFDSVQAVVKIAAADPRFAGAVEAYFEAEPSAREAAREAAVTARAAAARAAAAAAATSPGLLSSPASLGVIGDTTPGATSKKSRRAPKPSAKVRR